MDRKKSPIQQFFTRKNIVITGSTGACGKILLEKILRTLVDIGTIFLIIRPKRSLTGKQRLQKLLSTPLFSLNLIERSQLEKIVVIEGDICAYGLNMLDEDQEMLINEAQFIFHVAASIRFTAPLRETFTSNVIATENMLKFASRFKHLECFVHVSTAFSNCQLKTIDETLHPLSMDVQTLVEKFKSMDEQSLEIEGVKHMDGRPNNYTFTKAIAEHVVNSYFPKIPVVIARPAGVTPCINEPLPGFIHTLEGMTGILLLAFLGILQVTDWNFNPRNEYYPADYLANSLIAIAYNSRKKMESMKIYNLVSSPLNNYANFYGAYVGARKKWLESPSIYALSKPMVPQRFKRMSDIEYKIKRFIRHTMVAFFLDMILLLVGRKRMMLRIVTQMHKGLDALKYFVDNQWTFLCDNYKKMIDEMSEEDRAIFAIDISDVDYTKLLSDSMRTARRIIFKENEENIPIARLKLEIQCAALKAVEILVLYKLFLLVVSLSSICQLFPFSISWATNSTTQ